MAVPNLWRTKHQRYRLQAELCATCSQAVFPPREVCPHCRHPMQATVADAGAFVLPLMISLPHSAAPIAAGDD